MQSLTQLDQKLINLNWAKIGENLLTVLWQLLITSLVFYLISRLGKKVINHYLNNRKKQANKRTQTVTALINSIFQYTVIFFYLFGILSILGVPVGTLLASAGIFSLALGMGAQGFVSDLVNGFFILSEDQFDVGDTVQINGQTGIVLQLGLRTTRLKSINGSIIYVPNRNISIVENLTHGGIGVDLQLQLNANCNLTQVRQLIEQVNQHLKNKTNYLLQQPKIIGVTNQTNQVISYVVHFQAKPGKEYSIRDFYYTNYLQAFKQNKVMLAG